MQNAESGRMDRGSQGMSSTAGEKIGEAASTVQEKAEAGADALRENAASGLASAANRIRSQSDGQDGMQAQVQGKAADAIDSASQYISDHDTKQMWNDLERFVKEHPMQAAVGALVAGYVVAKVTR